MTPIRHLWHLATRFVGVLTSKRLPPSAQDEINDILEPAAAKLFWNQQAIDQRHAYEVAQRVRAAIGKDREALAAALLHDVGKSHSRLGAVSRSLATVFDFARIPMPDTWRSYRDHGALGARDLSEAGASPLAIAFAAGIPAGDPAVWGVLEAADDGRKKGRRSVSAGNSMPPEVSR